MDKHTFMLIGGVVIALMGFAYIVSERFALAFFYLRKFGMKSLFEILMSERAGVALIRFGLGPLLICLGVSLVVVALGGAPPQVGLSNSFPDGVFWGVPKTDLQFNA